MLLFLIKGSDSKVGLMKAFDSEKSKELDVERRGDLEGRGDEERGEEAWRVEETRLEERKPGG